MRFVLYARASTKDKQQPEHQIAELRTEAERRQWVIVAEFIEKESGRKDDRPLWEETLRLIRTNQADGVASVRLSRFARSTAHLCTLEREFREAGKMMVCTRQPVDTSTPMGRAFFRILAVIDELEAEITQENVTIAVRKAIDARGGAWGRQREAVPELTLQQVRTLRAAGRSWRDISDTLALDGHKQPARAHGRSAHPARPWPIGTLRDAAARVELPPRRKR
jgi:DNA invertase Pin-like site-specific DNA recombinase